MVCKICNIIYKLINSIFNGVKKLFSSLKEKLLSIFPFLKKVKRCHCVDALAYFGLFLVMVFVSGKTYQHMDQHEHRGAIENRDTVFKDGHEVPVYVDQGWDNADSLWFYNTTQGSGLLPYDFFLVLEQKDSTEPFRSVANIDRYRYLPQQETFFNPDALPVGFVKDTYQGKAYIGYTCAACHTGQVNYEGKAIRIDGGPSMADMPGFLYAMEEALTQTRDEPEKRQRFVNAVLELGNYDSREEVLNDLKTWTRTVQQYNFVNHSDLEYGYARLDAFGRIYNRVLEHIINKRQAKNVLQRVVDDEGNWLLTKEQVDLVLRDADETIIGNARFAKVIDRLMSKEPGYPGLTLEQIEYIREAIFNEPNAPVSYPFLWDITHSDYVQWNGIASNAGPGPLGRNAGEVIGVFGILDWEAKEPGFFTSIPALVSGQKRGAVHIDFKSSIDLVNLERLEDHLKSLQSPQWPEDILGEIDRTKAARGELVYARYCQSCHQIVERDNWDRLIVATMSSVKNVGTDPAMAENSVSYTGNPGNFFSTYQSEAVGTLIAGDPAPVAQILTAATKGVVATPDADKFFIRRTLDWLYVLGMSVFDNDIKPSIKAGNYDPDTTANPYQSLLAYKARSLNGIWATAPYLHNGSVPSLYDLLLPAKRDGDPDDGEYRPSEFLVGSREFDPVKVGFVTEGYDGFLFKTDKRGNFNTGHEYAAGRTVQLDGEVLPALSYDQRMDLLEFLKTL